MLEAERKVIEDSQKQQQPDKPLVTEDYTPCIFVLSAYDFYYDAKSTDPSYRDPNASIHWDKNLQEKNLLSYLEMYSFQDITDKHGHANGLHQSYKLTKWLGGGWSPGILDVGAEITYLGIEGKPVLMSGRDSFPSQFIADDGRPQQLLARLTKPGDSYKFTKPGNYYIGFYDGWQIKFVQNYTFSKANMCVIDFSSIGEGAEPLLQEEATFNKSTLKFTDCELFDNGYSMDYKLTNNSDKDDKCNFAVVICIKNKLYSTYLDDNNEMVSYPHDFVGEVHFFTDITVPANSAKTGWVGTQFNAPSVINNDVHIIKVDFKDATEMESFKKGLPLGFQVEGYALQLAEYDKAIPYLEKTFGITFGSRTIFYEN